MSTVAEIETAIRKLQPSDLKALHALIEEILEDELEVSEAFNKKIAEGKREIAEGGCRSYKVEIE